jgi:hypothetical protein
MQSNPIQQRIEAIGEKWEEAKKFKIARIVRMQCQPDELDMADTFYSYMIAADTPVYDIAFHFDSRCFDGRDFSTALLNELEEVIEIWNNSKKDERIEYVPVHWQPDYSLLNAKNQADLFVQNFNRLADSLNLPEGYFAVAVFKSASLDKTFVSWLRCATETNIGKNVKFLVHEVVNHPRFESIAIKFPALFATIPLNLNMPKGMEQAAAMGDPLDPATPYRVVFMKMMNAMTASKEKEAEKYGQACMEMATQNLAKDPYWIMQVVVVNIALGNDKIRYKKKKETVDYANKAVEAATAAQTHFENNVASGLLSQALMFRGSVFYMQSNWSEGYTDFNTAFGLFCKDGNLPLAIEASRVGGQCALKSSQKKAGLCLWVEGARLGKSMDADTARASTYAALLKQLLVSDYQPFIATDELHGIAQNLYGPGWADTVRNWNKAPGETVKQQQAVEALSV